MRDDIPTLSALAAARLAKGIFETGVKGTAASNELEKNEYPTDVQDQVTASLNDMLRKDAQKKRVLRWQQDATVSWAEETLAVDFKDAEYLTDDWRAQAMAFLNAVAEQVPGVGVAGSNDEDSDEEDDEIDVERLLPGGWQFKKYAKALPQLFEALPPDEELYGMTNEQVVSAWRARKRARRVMEST